MGLEMSITCAVSCQVNDQQDRPVKGALITATLSAVDVRNGYIAPFELDVETDALGHATLNLWPNQLGAVASFYKIRITTPSGKSVRTTAVVPNAPTAQLHLISELPPYEGKTTGYVLLDTVATAAAKLDASITAAQATALALTAVVDAAGAPIDPQALQALYANLRGPQGSKGDTGMRGPAGPQGPKGDTGATGNGSGGSGAQGATGAQGARGTAGADGTQGAKGDRGDQGLQGYQGVDGPVGPVGERGAMGPRGPQGVTGLNGSAGLRGDTGLSGVAGDTGAQGIQGLTGLTGATGDTGAQGPRGLPGAQGFTGIKGDVGARGATGEQGIQGATGEKGDTGATGDTGIRGVTGLQGATGGTGATGAAGAKGDSGVKGDSGATGAKGEVGAAGAAGAQGVKGDTGTAGAAGEKGDAGDAGATGATGATGDAGAKGDTGEAGLQGIQGRKGDAGDGGATGDAGVQGLQGLQGLQGDVGAQGIQGIKGDDGPQGIQGATGDQGATGAKGDIGVARFKRVAWANPMGSSTTLAQAGLMLIATGTAVSTTVTTLNAHQMMRRLYYAASVAAVNAVAGTRGLSGQWFRGAQGSKFGGFNFLCRFGPSTGAAANATRRGFCGLHTATLPTDVNPSTVQNILGVGCDAADTTYHIMHKDSLGAVTKVDTGISKSAADFTEVYELDMSCIPGGDVVFKFTNLTTDEVFTHTASTNLPAATALLNPQLWYSVGGTSSVIGASLMHLSIDTDY